MASTPTAPTAPTTPTQLITRAEFKKKARSMLKTKRVGNAAFLDALKTYASESINQTLINRGPDNFILLIDLLDCRNEFNKSKIRYDGTDAEFLGAAFDMLKKFTDGIGLSVESDRGRVIIRIPDGDSIYSSSESESDHDDGSAGTKA